MADGAHKTSKVVRFQDSVDILPVFSGGALSGKQRGEDQLTSLTYCISIERVYVTVGQDSFAECESVHRRCVIDDERKPLYILLCLTTCEASVRGRCVVAATKTVLLAMCRLRLQDHD